MLNPHYIGIYIVVVQIGMKTLLFCQMCPLVIQLMRAGGGGGVVGVCVS